MNMALKLDQEEAPKSRTLRRHQVVALDMVKQSLRSGKKRPMLQCPTGFGKTVVAAAIVRGCLDKGNRIIFCVPAVSLIDQTVQSFWHEGIECGVIQADHWMTDYGQPVQVASIQTLARRRIPDADVVVIDEAHRWFKFYGDWMNRWRNVPFIGLSATPWTKGLGKYYDDLLIASTTQELIDNKFLSPFRVYAPSKPDLSGVKTVAGDYHEGDLGDAMDKSPLTADIVSTWLKLGENRPTLCFAVNRGHAQHLAEQFNAYGVPTGYIDAYTEREERLKIAYEFAEGRIKVVCNVGCLTMGIDWDVRCIVMARPTRSEMLFCLSSDTEILTSRGWSGIGEIRSGDCVAALDSESGAGVWSGVLATVERDMSPEESWIEYEAPRSNFRVTDQHKMYVRKRKSGYQFIEAGELPNWSGDSIFMRTAVEIDQSGVPLTDDELYFIGMMMADGTWTSTAGSISQSERYPEILERIEGCLARCGIGYSKRRIAADGAMNQRFARWVYSFSAGKPKAHGNTGRSMCGNDCKTTYTKVAGTTGYRHLLPYMDKDFATSLMGISRRQFKVFIGGLFDGDGFKKKAADYLPETMDICTARKNLADRIQALCAINGINCSVAVENGESRKSPIYIVRLKDQIERSHGGYDSRNKPRPKIEKKAATSERVWCVQTEHGTIVTRRKGKVTVMGNCQIMGRGLRTADGKDDLLILDHSNTHLNLGFVTDILHDELDDGKPNKSSTSDKEKAEVLPKECPKCTYLKPPMVRVCPACGFEAKYVKPIETEAGELKEITGKKKQYSKEEKQRWYSMIRYHAKATGKQEGWVGHTYRDKFGVWPKGLQSGIMPPDEEVANFIKHKMIAFAKRRSAS